MATEVSAAPMRKLLNDPADLVKESLAGLAAAHARILRYDAEAQILTRADAPVPGKVALISGGGSGHEPLHGGFVGKGMLHAACPGEVFTSPVPERMLAATKAVDGGAGVIHIVKNYSGDVMRFKLAAEDAADDGSDVESVLVDDDVAVQELLYTAGRRGVGATVLLEKIAGASAERGDDLATVAGVARRVSERAGPSGSPCPPARRRRPGSGSSTSRRAKSRSESESTASRAAGAGRSPRRASSPGRWSSRCSRTSSPADRACWPSSMA